MNPPTLYKWRIDDLDYIRDCPFDDSASGKFKLNSTNIEFCLIFNHASEYSQDYCALYLQIFEWNGETSVTLQFRLWIESAIGEKLMEKPFGSTHTFTHDDNEHIGDNTFILRDQLISSDFDFSKYGYIPFCCEMLHIKPDAGILTKLDFYIKSQFFHSSGFTDDCILKTNDQEFTVAKNLIMASSEIFEQMFRSKTQEAKSGIVNLEDFSAETIEKFIQYLHIGRLNEVDQFAEGLFKFASRYSVEKLNELCVKSLAKTFSEKNIVCSLKLAFEFKNAELKNYVLFYVTNYGVKGKFDQILKSAEWEKLLRESPELANEILHISMERRVYKFNLRFLFICLFKVIEG